MDFPDLHFNILPINWLKEDPILYFHKEEQPKSYRLDKSQFPKNLARIFPDLNLSEQAFIYTSFDQQEEGFVPMAIDPWKDNPQFARLYFHHQVYQYFKEQCELIVHPSFANGTGIWVPALKNDTVDCHAYECFSLRVQLHSIGDLPELLVVYERPAEILRRSVADITPFVSTTNLEWVLVGKRLITYRNFVREGKGDYAQVYPVMNDRLKEAMRLRKAIGFRDELDFWKELDLSSPTSSGGNRYEKYLRYINGFYSKFLDTAAFRSVVPIHEQFLRVSADLVHFTHQKENDHQPGQITRQAGSSCIHAINPYKQSPHPNIQMFFIAHEQDQHLIETAKQYLFKGHGRYPGLRKSVQLNVHPNKELDIVFQNLNNPYLEINRALDANACGWLCDVTYIAVFISPYKQIGEDLAESEAHYQVVKALLFRSITTQELAAEELINPRLQPDNFFADIAIKMLAKLGGLPWRPTVPVKNELTIGVHAFIGKMDKVPCLSAAASYSNEGKFTRFAFFPIYEARMMAGFISYMTRMYSYEHGYPSRMVIHLYQQMSDAELAPFLSALNELNFPKPIPIFIVSFYEAETDDILAFDTGWEGLMPYSGTVIRLGKEEEVDDVREGALGAVGSVGREGQALPAGFVGRHRYLLFNNKRYRDGGIDGGGAVDGASDIDAGGRFDGDDGFPFPMKMEISCTDKKLLNEETVRELIGQVYQYSRMHLNKDQVGNLPVTVGCLELLEKKMPFFKAGVLTGFGGENAWFL